MSVRAMTAGSKTGVRIGGRGKSRRRRAARVLGGLGASILVVSTVLASAGVTERVSVDSAENQANGPSLTFVDVSTDGAVVFSSDASNLVPGDTNGQPDIFVRDRLSGTTERVNVDSFGNQANGFSALSPAISDDGRYVAFISNGSNLVPDDTNGETDAFVHDRVSGATERVGTFAGNNMVDISGDGRYVVFDSFAPLVAGDTNDGGDVFVYDRLTGSTERVSVDSGGNQADTGASYVVQSLHATTNSDGRYVEFMSNATNLVPADTNATWDVFVHDRQTETTERISVDSDENQSHEPRVPASSGPAIFSYLSADGRFAAFLSAASDLVAGDTDGQEDVFIRDRIAGTTELASVDTTGTSGGHAGPATISADGRSVAFWSCVPLVSSDTNGLCDVYVRDRSADTTNILSVDPSGDSADDHSYFPAIDPSGRYVAFTSDATNLVPGDANNGFRDVFIRDTAATAVPATVTLSPPDAVNEVGTSHTVTATVRDVSGRPVAGVVVRFSTSGSTSVSGSCTTDSNGQCDFSYVGPQLPGADIISAYADADNDGTKDPTEPQFEATKAWMLPATTPGQVTGGGQILNAAGDDKVAFGFNARSSDDQLIGNCSVVDPHPSTNVRIKCLDVTSLVRTGTHATFFGNATSNGAATTYRIDVDGLDEPGSDQDTFRIQTTSGYTVGGTLTNGNIQIHDR